MKKEEVIKEIKKIITDFESYYLKWEIEEMTVDDLIYILEHEVDLYKNWQEEGFKNKQQVSYVNKTNIRKVNGLLARYYNKEKKMKNV